MGYKNGLIVLICVNLFIYFISIYILMFDVDKQYSICVFGEMIRDDIIDLCIIMMCGEKYFEFFRKFVYFFFSVYVN